MGNQQGKERRDYGRRIDWKNAEPPSSPGKPFLVPDEGNPPSDVITIRWSPPMTDGGAPILGYLVEHRRTGSPHWLRATPDLVPTTQLPLTGLEPGWRYQFRVSAENDIGRSEPGELSEPLTVTPQKWAASAPFFNVELQDTIGLENEKVEFKVQVIGIPPPTIAWYKDGFETFSSRRTKIVTENDQSTFIIHQAALEDEGEIKCTATNRAGHAVTKATLKLEAPPRIRLPRQYEDGLIFEKGELIRLKVTTAGRPTPEVFWYHNGELLQKNERTEMGVSETGFVVKIRDACRDDRGEYVIKGVNKIGEDVASFLVTVTDRPSPPGKVQVVTIGRTVTLSWSSPDDDGGCKIGSYIVEYFRVGWDMWLKARTCRQLSAILEDLIEGSEYKFRVRAENPYGTSEPSLESDAIFIPDLKRGILKPPPKPPAQEVFKETKTQTENIEETEEEKRRRLLKERAHRLLDTPQPYTNAVRDQHTSEEINDENAPPPVPKRRKGKGRLTPSPVVMDGPRLTPSPIEGGIDKNKLTPSPTLSAKTFKTAEVVNGTVEKPNWGLKKAEENGFKFKEQDPFEGEGPMYPRENDDSIMHGSSELMLVIYPRDRSKSVELNAQQRSEIEMSLAADGVAPPMSLSAPELGGTEIFEQPPLRDAVSSTELLYERTAARLYQDSIDEEAQRKVKRRYSMDRKSVERRSSLREPLEKRLSFKGNQDDQPNKPQSEEEAVNHKPNKPVEEEPAKPREEFLSKIPKLERLSSVEKERLEFAMVRDRLKQKEEEEKARKRTISHGSETSTTATSSSIETEELEYEDDSLGEEEEEDYLDEDTNEKETDTDYINDMDIPVIDTSLTLPKPIRIAPFAEREEDTYHPRSMIPTRSIISKLPAEEVKTITQPTQPEIKPPPPPLQPETKPEDSSKTSKIPIPKMKKTTKILKKFGLKKDKKIPQVTLTPADQDSPPTVLPKPILKNKNPRKKDSPQSLLKFAHSKPTDKSISEEESESEFPGKKKKQVRIAEPNDDLKKVEEKPVDENAKENQVLIFHYSDIVKEFGGNKKPPARMYLNYEELKAHAKEPEKVNSSPYQSEQKPTNLKLANQKQEIIKPEIVQTPKSETVQALKPEIPPPEEPKPETSRTKIKINSLEYLTDIIMFIIACCLYLFKNELYAIPILAIMAYRQLKDITLEKYENLKKSVSKIIPNKLKGKAESEGNIKDA